MDMRRRSLIAALLCTPGLIRGQQVAQKITMIELPENFVLEVHHGNKVVTLKAEEIMNGLEPIQVAKPVRHPVIDLLPDLIPNTTPP